MKKRTNWGSSTGFLLSAVGSAVGFGTVWAFPYKMGKYGGFTFLSVYLVLALLFGVILLSTELAIGRLCERGPAGAYKKLTPGYSICGPLAVMASFFIMVMYATLGAYSIEYFLMNIKALFKPLALSGEKIFRTVLDAGKTGVLFTVVFVFLNYLIVKGGIQKGIEKFNMVGMPLLFLMLIVIIIKALSMPNAIEGLKYMFVPEYAFEKGFIQEKPGNIDVLSSAVSQLFFSLSIGMGSTIVYGSYLKKSENLVKSAFLITLCDTVISVMSGLAVLPVAVANVINNSIPPSEIELGGPKLLFVTLQDVFNNMGTGGAWLGIMFFLLILIAAISSGVSLIEVVCSYFTDKAEEKGKVYDREKIAFWVCIAILIPGILVTLDGFGTKGFMIPFKSVFPHTAFTQSWLNFFSCIAEGICMPVGTFLMCMAVTNKITSGEVLNEIKKGARLSGSTEKIYMFCIKWLVPAVIFFMTAGQILDYFVP